jgi:malonyl-CoA/methylmalonyl-CoA synthetase
MSRNLYLQIARGDEDLARTAIRWPDGSTMSHAALHDEVGRMANALVSLGLKPGERLVAQVEKSVEALVLYYATVCAGGVFVPLNIAYTAHEVAYLLTDAEPAIVVADPARLAGIAEVAEQIGARAVMLRADGGGTLTDIVGSMQAEFETTVRGEDDLAAILYTSGTTGRSKGAMLTHRNLVSNAEALRALWRFTPDDVLIHALPIFHTHGLFVACNVALFAGASMIFLPKFDAADVIRHFRDATVLMGVPTFYVRLLREPALTREAAQNMRLFVSGSAPLSDDTHREWFARTGHAILERYGMTETSMNTSNPYDGLRLGGSVGLPLPGVSLRVTEPDTGVAVEGSEVGMIEVKGPNVFAGYWRMPEKTAAEMRPDGWFVTGDLGWRDESGYLHIVGRAKDVIITGGYNVYPKEVEEAIDAIEGVVESAVVGAPDPEFGESVAAAVVRDARSAVTVEEIDQALETRLAKFKRPRRIVFVPDLPRNAMGKVEKRVLRERFAAEAASAGASAE